MKTTRYSPTRLWRFRRCTRAYALRYHAAEVGLAQPTRIKRPLAEVGRLLHEAGEQLVNGLPLPMAADLIARLPAMDAAMQETANSRITNGLAHLARCEPMQRAALAGSADAEVELEWTSPGGAELLGRADIVEPEHPGVDVMVTDIKTGRRRAVESENYQLAFYGVGLWRLGRLGSSPRVGARVIYTTLRMRRSFLMRRGELETAEAIIEADIAAIEAYLSEELKAEASAGPRYDARDRRCRSCDFQQVCHAS